MMKNGGERTPEEKSVQNVNTSLWNNTIQKTENESITDSDNLQDHWSLPNPSQLDCGSPFQQRH